MLFPMRRVPFLALLVSLLLSFQLEAMSMHAPFMKQPFDSTKALQETDFSQSGRYEKGATLSLVVMGPLKPLYSWFGHCALLVTLPSGRQTMYDYGVFDTQAPGFLFNFLKGRMMYNIWRNEGTRRMAYERSTGRRIEIYPLPLTQSQVEGAIAFLDLNTSEGNDTYLYHFYKDNCATRLRDVIDAATGGTLKAYATEHDDETSYRNLSATYLGAHPVMEWLLELIQGPGIDEPVGSWEAMCMPEVLAKAVSDCYGIRPQLIQEGDLDLQPQPLSQSNYRFLSFLSGAAILLLLLAASRKPALWRLCMGLVLLFLSITSLGMAYCMCFSTFDMAWYNVTFLAVNPLCIVALVALVRNHTYRVRNIMLFNFWVAVILAAGRMLVSSVFVQDNIPALLVLLPVYASSLFTDAWPEQARSRRPQAE